MGNVGAYSGLYFLNAMLADQFKTDIYSLHSLERKIKSLANRVKGLKHKVNSEMSGLLSGEEKSELEERKKELKVLKGDRKKVKSTLKANRKTINPTVHRLQDELRRAQKEHDKKILMQQIENLHHIQKQLKEMLG